MRGRKFTGEEVREIRRALDMGLKGEVYERYRGHALPPAIIAIKEGRTWGDPKYIPAAFCHQCSGKVLGNEEDTIALCVKCGADYIGKLPIQR